MLTGGHATASAYAHPFTSGLTYVAIVTYVAVVGAALAVPVQMLPSGAASK